MTAASLTCPICELTVAVRRGRVVAHNYAIRGWGKDAAGDDYPADITVTCAPRIRIVRP